MQVSGRNNGGENGARVCQMSARYMCLRPLISSSTSLSSK